MTDRNWVFITLVISAVIRGGFVWLIYPDTSILMESDQLKYLELSNVILSGKGFGTAFTSGRVPVYPIFLALLRTVFDNFFFIVIVQHLLGLCIVPVLFAMGNLFSKRAARLSAVMAGVNLNFIAQSNSLLTEALFYPLFAIFVLITMRFLCTPLKRTMLYAGLLLGFCTLIRPITMYFPFFFVPFLLWVERAWGERFKYAAIFVLSVMLFLVPWMYRNSVVYGKFALISQGGGHLVGWIIPSVMQNEEHIDISSAMKKSISTWEAKKQKFPEEKKTDPFYLDGMAKKHTLEYLASTSPFSIIKAWLWGSIKNMFTPAFVEVSYMLKMEWTHFYETPGESFLGQAFNFTFRNQNKTYSVCFFASALFLMIFRLIQLVGAFRLLNFDFQYFIFAILIIAYFLMVSGPVGYAKYRVPFEPILVLLTSLPWAPPVLKKT